MYALVPFFFITVFVLLISFLNYSSSLKLETNTFFECGFEAVQTFRSLFSLRFFSISVVFLIFDTEIIFVLPLVFFYNSFKFILGAIYIILLLGVLLEWNQGGLNWN